MRFAFVLATLSLLSGCATMQPQKTVVNLSAPFNSAQAAKMMEPGLNVLKGNAFLRQRGGTVVTCAGSDVDLLPATDYAKQRIAAIYQGASVRSFSGPRVTFVPDVAEYRIHSKRTKCDAQGNFAFEQVGDGDYFVTTLVHWQVGYQPQGGALVERVQVRGGETKSIVLTGN